MFVRFKRRERVSVRTTPWKARRRTGRFVLTAVLVRSERRDGKPRQKVVAYLASIAEEDFAKVLPRQHFWARVDTRLGALNLEPGQRQKVEAALLAVVARPTPEEISEDRRQFEARLDALRSRCVAGMGFPRSSRRRQRPST